MLRVCGLLLGLVLWTRSQQGLEPGLFHWQIEGMGSSSRPLLVTITPTLFAVVNSFDPKTITLDLVPAPDDPDPTTMTPEKTEPAPKSGLRATFTRPPRRFTLTVTLADGSTQKVNPGHLDPAEEPKANPTRLLQFISFIPVPWTD